MASKMTRAEKERRQAVKENEKAKKKKEKSKSSSSSKLGKLIGSMIGKPEKKTFVEAFEENTKKLDLGREKPTVSKKEKVGKTFSVDDEKRYNPLTKTAVRTPEKDITVGNIGRTREELERRKSTRDLAQMTSDDWLKKSRDAVALKDSEKAGVGLGTIRHGTLNKNAEMFMQNWNRVPQGNKVDAAIQIIYTYGVNDQNRALVMSAFNGASTFDKRKMMDAVVQTDGWSNVAYEMRNAVNNAPDSQQALMQQITEDMNVRNGNYLDTFQRAANKGIIDQNTLQQKEDKVIADWAKENYNTAEALKYRTLQTGAGFVNNLTDTVAFGISELLQAGQQDNVLDGINPFEGIGDTKGLGNKVAKFGTNVLHDLFRLAGINVSVFSKTFLTQDDVDDIAEKLMSITEPYHEAVRNNMIAMENGNLSEAEKELVEVYGMVIEQIPNIVMSLVASPAAGLATTGMTAGGKYARSAFEQGATLEQAVQFGLAGAAAEVGSEKLFTGFGYFGKGLSSKLLTDTTRKLIDGSTFKNSVAADMLRRVVAGGGEATEEMIVEIITPYLERSTYDPSADGATMEEILHSGGMGFIVAQILGLPANALGVTGKVLESRDTKAREDMLRGMVTDAVKAGRLSEADAANVNEQINDIRSGKGTLTASEAQEEVKTTGENLDAVYANFDEAREAMQAEARGKQNGESVSARFMQDGEAKLWTAKVMNGGIVQVQQGITTGKEKAQYAAKAQKVASATNTAERTGYQLNVRDEIVKEVSAISKAINREVEFISDSNTAMHGYVQNDKIYVNVNSTQSPARAVVAHEMTHMLEGTSSYARLRDMVYRQYGSSVADKRSEIIANYDAAGIKLGQTKTNGYDEVDTELMAMFVEEKLLTDSDSIRQIVREDRTLAQKIVDWINKVIQKISGSKEQRFLIEARDLWSRALQENKKAPLDGAKYSAGYRGIDVPKSEYRIISQEFMNKISAFWAKGLPVPNYIEVNTYFAGYSCLVTDKENGYFIVADEYELVNIHDIEEFEKGSDTDANKRTKTDVQGVSTDRFSGQSIGERSVGSIKDKRSATADGGLYERSGSVDLRRGNRQNSRIDKINKQYSIGKMQDESSASFNLQELEDRIAELQKQDSQLNSRLDEYRNAPEHQKMMDAIGILKDDELDRAVDEYKKWYTSSGYEALYNEEQAVYDELHKLRIELEDAKKEKAKNDKLNYRALFNEEFNKKYATKAERHFGTTYKFAYAGYLTVNGSLLDFSAGQRYRVRDHREISEVLDFLPEDHGYSDALIEFMNMGNIRMQTYGIDISVAPNAKQKTVLRKFFDSLFGEVTVDFSRENGDSAGSVDYPEGTRSERIIRDIDNYFKTGVVPEISETQRYRFSIGRSKDAAYLDAVNRGDMAEAQRMVDEAAEVLFSNSKVRDNDGKLRKVFHGTVNEFTVFDRQFANIEGDFGKGYYFTSNENDVDENYANEEGADLKNKIARYAERLEWDDEYSDLSDAEREKIARQKFITSEPNTIEAYLNMQNPVYINTNENGTFLDYEYAYDEEYDEYGEPEGLLVDFIEALNDIAAEYSYGYVDFGFLHEYGYAGGMQASDAVGVIKRTIIDELTNEDGDLAVNEVIRRAFEEIGFDGIIDSSVFFKFRNMPGMTRDTTHYIVFDSNQIKSADPVTYDDDGNIIPLSQRFNEESYDIRWSIGRPTDTKAERRDAEATMRMHDRLIKEVYNEAKSLSAEEKREIREAVKDKDKARMKKELAKRAAKYRQERSNATKNMNAVLKEAEKQRKEYERKLSAPEKEAMRKQQEKTDRERRAERIRTAKEEYKRNAPKPAEGSTEALYLQNNNAQDLIKRFRRDVITYLVEHDRFVETNGEVVLDENGMEIAYRNREDEWTISKHKNTYTPSWGLTLLADKEGIDKDVFFTIYSKIADMRTKRKKDGTLQYKKADVVKYIGMLKLTAKQKDFLYFDVAKYAYATKPNFMSGGAIEEKAGNTRGRMMEALDNIGLDMFAGSLNEDYFESTQIREQDVIALVDAVFGKEDSQERADFALFLSGSIIDYSDQMETVRMLEKTKLLTDKPKEKNSVKMQILRAYRESKRLFVAEGEAFERMGEKLKNPLITARYYGAKKSSAIANEMIYGKTQRDLQGKKHGKSLYDIFKPVFRADEKAGNNNNMKELTELVNCRHDIYRLRNGKGYTGYSIEECEKIVDRISREHPELLKVADEIAEYGRNLLRMCVESGRISQADFDYFTAKYPYYAPTFRLRSNEYIDRKGNVVRRDTKVIRTAVGGNDDVLPLFDQFVRRTQEIVKACKKNQLASELAKAYTLPNSAEYIRDVRKAEKQEDKEKEIASLGEVEDIGRARKEDGNENIIPWYSNGQKYDIEVEDEALLYGWDRITYRRNEYAIATAFRKINNVRRGVLTQYNPTFWLTNGVKDIQDMYLYNQHAQRLPKFHLEAAKTMFAGTFGKGKNEEALEEYLSFGMSQASIFEYDNTNSGRRTKRTRVKEAMRKPIDAFNALNFMVEQTPRLAVYNEAVDRLSKDRQNGDNTYTDEEIKTIAAYQASDATLNFGRSGTVVKEMNTYGFTFLNAGIQGMDRFRRMFTQVKDGDRRALIINLCGLIMKLAIVGVGWNVLTDWIYGGDDEYAKAIREALYGEDSDKVAQEYNEMADYQRTNYLLLNINGTWIRIPKGRLASFVYGFVYNGEKVASGEMDALDLVAAQMDLASETILFSNPITNNIMGPFIDVWRNKDAWDVAIVSEYEDMGEGFHYLESDEETTDLAIKLAEFGHYLTADLFGVEDSRILDISPKKLDYLIEQYLGSYSNMIMPFLSKEQNLKDNAIGALTEIIRKFYIDPTSSNRLAGDYYDLKEEFENTANAHENDSPYAVAAKVFDDYTDQLKSLRDEINAIDADSSLSKKEKLAQISELRGQMNDLYRQGIIDAKDALGFAHANYYGKDGNSEIYEDWQKTSKGADWVVTTMSDSAQEKFALVEKDGVDAENFVNAYSFISNATADKDENGKTISGSKKEKIVNYLNSLDLTAEQKMSLYTNVAGYKVSDRSPAPSFVNGALVQPSTSNMASPIAGGGRMTSGYGWRNCPFHGREFHQAVDIAADEGSDVGAVISGTVTMATVHGGYGNSIEITSVDKNGNTVVTKYNHLLNMGVEVGDVINQGTKIGEVGSTGDSTGPHLDFRLKINNDWVDPTQYLKLEESGVVDATGYTPKEGTGGTASSGGYSGGSGGGSRKNTASYSSLERKSTNFDSVAKLTGNGSAGSSYTGRGVMLPTAAQIAEISSRNVTGRSTKAPSYGKAGVYLPKASEMRNTPTSFGTSVATTKRTGRTGGSLWDENILS